MSNKVPLNQFLEAMGPVPAATSSTPPAANDISKILEEMRQRYIGQTQIPARWLKVPTGEPMTGKDFYAMQTTNNPGLVPFLQHLCACAHDEVDTSILIFADWLEEQDDYRAEKLRVMVAELQDIVFGLRDFRKGERHKIVHELVAKHRPPEFGSFSDMNNRREVVWFDRRGAALRRFGIEQVHGEWFIVKPEVDLVEACVPGLPGTLFGIPVTQTPKGRQERFNVGV